jgi:prepilin-type N-terminal cleavage/methylation domain-containing protein
MAQCLTAIVSQKLIHKELHCNRLEETGYILVPEVLFFPATIRAGIERGAYYEVENAFRGNAIKNAVTFEMSLSALEQKGVNRQLPEDGASRQGRSGANLERRNYEEMSEKQGGFTLIEFVVVVALAAALIGLTAILLAKGKAAANFSTTQERIRAISTGLTEYAMFKHSLPVAADMTTGLARGPQGLCGG